MKLKNLLFATASIAVIAFVAHYFWSAEQARQSADKLAIYTAGRQECLKTLEVHLSAASTEETYKASADCMLAGFITDDDIPDRWK